MSDTPVLANDTVTAVVHHLLGLRRRRGPELAAHLGFDSGTMSKAMNGHRRWTVQDLARMGEFFNVQPGVFFVQPDEMVDEALRSRWSWIGNQGLDAA